MIFHDRTHAGFMLVEQLKKHRFGSAVVLAIPRGGVPVGYTIARQLGLPLDVIMAKKIGHPFNPEYAIGAVSESKMLLTDTGGITDEYVQSEVKRLRQAMNEKYKTFTRGRVQPKLAGKAVILVDDGLATGNTMEVCIEEIKKESPSKLIVAVPVASSSSAKKIQPLVDEFICLLISSNFTAVGSFYENFHEISDESVSKFLEKIDEKNTFLSYAI